MNFTDLVKRVLSIIPTILGVTVVVFVIVRLIPGDPVTIMIGGYGTYEQMEAARKLLGLDQPIYVQYFLYLERLLKGDWGYSMESGIVGGVPVLSYVALRFMRTLALAVASIALGSLIGIVLGILSATRRGKIDQVVRTISLLGFSIPVFWMGIIYVIVFSLTLHLFPSMGGGGPEHLVLPTLTLATFLFGLICRVTRAAALDVMHQDFILTARAKGLKKSRILIHHILRNSLIPVITVISLQFGSLIGGAVVTETVFNYPGLGLLIVDSLFKRDYPVVQGGMLLIAVVMTLTVFFSDIAYTLLDPRVRYATRE